MYRDDLPSGWLPWVAAGLGMVLLLCAAPLIATAGLGAPVWALALLLGAWLALVALGAHWVRRRPYLVLLLPVVAVALWWLTIVVGGGLFGWGA